MLQATEQLRTTRQLQAMEQLRAAIDVLQECDIQASSDEAICEQIIMMHRQINRLQAAWSKRVVVAERRGSAAAGGYLTTATFLRHSC